MPLMEKAALHEFGAAGQVIAAVIKSGDLEGLLRQVEASGGELRLAAKLRP
jgi:hypothetical protein